MQSHATYVKHEIVGLCFLVTDDGVHASDLKVAGNDLQVVVDAFEIWLLQLQANVLRDQVNGNVIVNPVVSVVTSQQRPRASRQAAAQPHTTTATGCKHTTYRVQGMMTSACLRLGATKESKAGLTNF